MPDTAELRHKDLEYIRLTLFGAQTTDSLIHQFLQVLNQANPMDNAATLRAALQQVTPRYKKELARR